MFAKADSSTPDHELLLRIHRGDDRAARELWSRFGPSLIAYAAALLHDRGGRAAGEDIAQQVFCRILELPRARLAQVRDVRAWLTGLARHAALNERRARTREQHRAADRASIAPQINAPGPGAATDLAGGIAALQDDLREVVLLKHAAGLTFDQMAGLLETPRGTLAARYGRAIELLRGGCAASEGPGPARKVGAR